MKSFFVVVYIWQLMLHWIFSEIALDRIQTTEVLLWSFLFTEIIITHLVNRASNN